MGTTTRSNANVGVRVYLDHAATTPLDKEILSLMLPYWGESYGNPSSLHESGRRAARAIAEARERIARRLAYALADAVKHADAEHMRRNRRKQIHGARDG